jgi:hypothetical protein
MMTTVSEASKDGRRPVSAFAVSPGAAVAARRRALGITIEDVVNTTRGVMNQKLLSRIENNHVNLAQLRVSKLAALLSALRWEVADLEAATGVTLGEGLPGADVYLPSVRVRVLGTLRGGLEDVEVSLASPTDVMMLDPHVNGVRGTPVDSLVALVVADDSLLSERVARAVPVDSTAVVELRATPRKGEIAAVWLPKRAMAALVGWGEDDAVVRTPDPSGPAFRLANEAVEVRGVVRLVQFHPSV